MEALVALGLVCNIAQLVEQGLEVTRVFKEFKKTGSSAELDRAQKLQVLIASTRESCATAIPAGTQDVLEQKLQTCVGSSMRLAQQLADKLNNVLYKDTASTEKRSTIDRTYRMLRARAEIEALERNLIDTETFLQTTILLSLRTRLERLDKTVIGQDANLQKLLDGDCKFAKNVLEGLPKLEVELQKLRASLSVARDEIVKEGKASEDHLRSRMEQIAFKQRTDLQIAALGRNRQAVQQRLMDALYFEGVAERKNALQQNYDDEDGYKTMEWLFTGEITSDATGAGGYDGDLKIMKRVHVQFTEWLASTDQEFWIAGKPGSGKSVLMSHIGDNVRADLGGPGHDILTQWSGHKGYTVLDFFFFRPSSNALQKTQQGFWRCLIFQLLQALPELIDLTLQDASAPITLRQALDFDRALVSSWNTKQLAVWFQYLVSRTRTKVFVLLDGLDELEGNPGDHTLLLKAIQRVLNACKEMKILCSSRTDQPFAKAFAKTAQITVQDINYNDILAFCASKLRDTSARFLIEELAAKSDGVFLWARLVTSDLERAAEYESNEELQARVDFCPSDMIKLFDHLLMRHELRDEYTSRNPAPYLLLVHLSTKYNG